MRFRPANIRLINRRDRVSATTDAAYLERERRLRVPHG